jgi:hypothetical protein
VLNEYNAAGPLLIDGSDAVALAIDGRADRFAPEWVVRIEDAHAARRDVEQTLVQVDPDAVVTAEDSPLSRLLRERGWSVDRVDGDWELLLPSSTQVTTR